MLARGALAENAAEDRVSAPLVIFLAGTPVAKGRPRFTKAGHTYTPEKTVNYETLLRLAAQQAMAGRKLFEGPLEVSVVAAMPKPKNLTRKRRAAIESHAERPTKKPDWDNFAKVLDALNEVVWLDDAQIVDGSVLKTYSDRPGMVIRIAPANKPAMPRWAANALKAGDIFS